MSIVKSDAAIVPTRASAFGDDAALTEVNDPKRWRKLPMVPMTLRPWESQTVVVQCPIPGLSGRNRDLSPRSEEGISGPHLRNEGSTAYLEVTSYVVTYVDGTSSGENEPDIWRTDYWMYRLSRSDKLVSNIQLTVRSRSDEPQIFRASIVSRIEVASWERCNALLAPSPKLRMRLVQCDQRGGHDGPHTAIVAGGTRTW